MTIELGCPSARQKMTVGIADANVFTIHYLGCLRQVKSGMNSAGPSGTSPGAPCRENVAVH